VERLNPSEVVGLLFALGGLLFVVAERRRLLRDPGTRLPLAGSGLLLAGWVLTLLEEFLWPRGLNFAEHLCYAAGTCLLATWCWVRVRAGGAGGGRP